LAVLLKKKHAKRSNITYNPSSIYT